MTAYALIFAGGSGARLWPLGRQKLPKQLIPFKNEQTLLDMTIERMTLLVPRENIWISTVAGYSGATPHKTSDCSCCATSHAYCIVRTKPCRSLIT